MQNVKCEKSRNPSISPCCTHFSLFSAKTYFLSVTHIFCICENCIRNYNNGCRINKNGGGILTERASPPALSLERGLKKLINSKTYQLINSKSIPIYSPNPQTQDLKNKIPRHKNKTTPLRLPQTLSLLLSV